MNKNSIPWGVLDIEEEGRELPLPFDQTLYFRKTGEEILISQGTRDRDTLYRFIAGKDNHIHILPVLPDLPITIKPKEATSILPGRKMEAYVEVPLILSILYGNGPKQEMLTEIPLDPLSRSFFGSPDNGELSYFLESSLFTDVESYSRQDSSIYCPVAIWNKSSQKLDVERMMLRVPLLTVFMDKDFLVSSPVSITFRGQDQVSQISYLKYSGEKKHKLQMISPPRQTEDNSLIKRSFFFLKNLYTG